MVKNRFLLLYLGLFCSCQSPLEHLNTAPMNPTSLTRQTVFSAKEGLSEAQGLASQWATDARLFKVSSPWVEQGGLSSEWSYHFYSNQAISTFVVKEGAGLTVSSTPSATYLSLKAGWLDSSQVTAFTQVKAFRFPLLSMQIDADGIWQIRTEFQTLTVTAHPNSQISP